MRRGRSTEFLGSRKRKISHLLFTTGAIYLVFIIFKFHHLLEIATVFSGDDSFSGLDRPVHDISTMNVGFDEAVNRDAFHRKLEDSRNLPRGSIAPVEPFWHLFRRKTVGVRGNSGNLSRFDKLVDEAWELGLKAWNETQGYGLGSGLSSLDGEGENAESCPSSVSVSEGPSGGDDSRLVFLPCGLVAGSSITVVGTPHVAHAEFVPELVDVGMGNGTVWVSQFTIELQGLKVVDGEEPPRILHLNPRLRGDWSQKPVIELNTCYRMQWGVSMRCNGVPLGKDDDTVDGFTKCEKWIGSDTTESKESKTSSWLKRFIGRAKKPEMVWSFPFAEGRLFVLTLQAGVEGFHIYVGGRHVASFPYRPGFTLEEATGLAIKGDVHVHSVHATSLPISHPRFSLDRVLEMSDQWKTLPLPNNPIDLFIGIISATNHFAERMAVRKTWMQSSHIKLSNVAARFFVALNTRKEVNTLLKKEAEFFGDIVILPFIDRYELVVLKTVAICEYAVQNLISAYIMKCDDDTFVRVNIVLKEIKRLRHKKSLYMGNINFLHRPLRHGKWAVTYEEWPGLVYPPYANGPGYVISSDISAFIVSQHANQNLRLFKMEDVSMGMWVEQFNASTTVHYSHSWNFCQHGCIENYYTAHYQSPRQMLCLWDKLAKGQARCCNFR